jgi:hypothetical protein
MYGAANGTVVPMLSHFGFSPALPKAQKSDDIVGTSCWNGSNFLRAIHLA